MTESPSSASSLGLGGTDVDEVSADVSIEPEAEPEVAAEPEPEVEADPAVTFREALRRAPGDWFVVHTYAGYENKAKANLETRIQSLNMEDFIYQIEVPQEEVTEIKNG